jgi:NPCBM/NEW2 domain
MSGLDRIFSPRHLQFWALLASIATVATLIIAVFGGSKPRSPPAGPPAPPTTTSQAQAEPEQTQITTSNALAPPPTPPDQPPSTSSETSSISTYLDDYAESGCGVGITGGSVSVNGMQYTHTVQQWAGDTTSSINLGRKASQFQATIGIRDDAQTSVQAQFFLEDETGKQVFRSNILKYGESQDVSVPVSDVLRLTLRVKAASQVWGYAVWGDARLNSQSKLTC